MRYLHSIKVSQVSMGSGSAVFSVVSTSCPGPRWGGEPSVHPLCFNSMNNWATLLRPVLCSVLWPGLGSTHLNEIIRHWTFTNWLKEQYLFIAYYYTGTGQPSSRINYLSNQQLPAHVTQHLLSHHVVDTLKQTMREKGRVMRKRLQETQSRMPPQSPMPLLLPSSSAWRHGVTDGLLLL